jgi:hypothetical protein
VPAALQFAPGQHTWPMPPQAVHRLLLHAKPLPQALPGQHACPLPPQGEH